MYNVMSQNGTVAYGMLELVVDTRSDIQTLPINCAPGSSCLVIEDFSVWLLNSKKQLVES